MLTAKRAVLVAGAASVLLVGGGAAGAAVASGPVTSGVVHACYVTKATATGGHALVLQNAGTRCSKGTTALTWNLRGPKGATGATGPTGPQGPAGPGLLAWAYVNANGTIASSSGNVAVSNPSPGSYCIGVTGGTAHVAVVSLDSLENTGGTVQAGVFDASGCPADASDIFVVTRPQSQDGGLPGVNHAFYIIVS
jgi:hypothetical protein